MIGDLMKPQARTAVQIPGCASVRNRNAKDPATRLRLCLPFYRCLDDLILHHSKFNNLIGNLAHDDSKEYRCYDGRNSPCGVSHLARQTCKML